MSSLGFGLLLGLLNTGFDDMLKLSANRSSILRASYKEICNIENHQEP